MSTEKEKKIHEEANKKIDEKNAKGVSDTKEKTSKEISETFDYSKHKEFIKSMEDSYGKNPTAQSVLEKLKKSDDFKDIKTYDEALALLREGKKDDKGNILIEKHPNVYGRLKDSVKKIHQKPDKETEKPDKENKSEKEEQRPDKETEKPKEEKDEKYKKDQKDDKKEEKEEKEENEKKEQPEKTGKKGFFGKVGSAAIRPFKKGYQAGKFLANSTIALTRSALKTARAPVSWPSHMLGYKSVSKGTKAWAQDYKKYRNFKKSKK